MYQLYYSPGAASFVVHWLLIELDAPHTLHKLDLAAGEHKRPEYLSINPNGVVPTLMVDGTPMTEAAALVMQLADRHPEAGLAPALGSRERGSYYQWLLYLANTLQPAFRLWFYPQEAAGEAAAETAKDMARAKVEGIWQRIEDHLAKNGPFLLGSQVSAADFHLTMLMRWSRNMPKPATGWPHLAALAEQMKARPSFAALYASEALTEWA